MSTGIVDAHAHLPLDTADTRGVLESVPLKVLNIAVASDELGGLDAQRGWYGALRRARPERFGWCTSFALDGFGAPGFAERALAGIEADLADGAVAVKIWKNVGMDLRDERGFVFIDDARFEPILAGLERRGVPLLMHIAEPLACWRPLDPQSPHHGYYSANPQWHWHGRGDVPSHERLIASRDEVVRRHPRLAVVGAHYGSLESDLDAVAARLERFPNFSVDTSARLGDLALHAAADREAVRRFFVRYAGRVLWGSDFVCAAPASAMDEPRRARTRDALRRCYETELRFFRDGDALEIGGRTARGLDLPGDVLDELLGAAARRVYRGL